MNLTEAEFIRDSLVIVLVGIAVVFFCYKMWKGWP